MIKMKGRVDDLPVIVGSCIAMHGQAVIALGLGHGRQSIGLTPVAGVGRAPQAGVQAGHGHKLCIEDIAAAQECKVVGKVDAPGGPGQVI